MDISATRRANLRMLIDHLAEGNINTFAARYGYARAQVSQYLSETYNGGRSMGERAARALEVRVGLSPHTLDRPILPLTGKLAPPPQYAEGDASGTDGETLELRLIPVRWNAATAELGLVELQPIALDGSLRYIQFASAYSDAYAILVKGNGLRPRAKTGECLLVEPSRKAQPGDDVLVELVTGEKLVQQFLFERDGDITFGQFNESGPPATCSYDEVVSMSVISGVVKQ